MLPNRLISQKPGGIMLFLALSEAIHCQTKRSPKIKLPVQPIIFQAFTSPAASFKIAKRDCMRSLSHRIFLAATRAPWSVASLPPSLKLWRTSARPMINRANCETNPGLIQALCRDLFCGSSPWLDRHRIHVTLGSKFELNPQMHSASEAPSAIVLRQDPCAARPATF
jgi:hypothetical protein